MRLHFKVCVKSCPKKYWVWATVYGQEQTEITVGGKTQTQVSAARTASDFYCKYATDPQQSTKVQLSKKKYKS